MTVTPRFMLAASLLDAATRVIWRRSGRGWGLLSCRSHRTAGFSWGDRPGKFRSFRPGAEEGRAISALLDRAVETGALEGVLAAVRDGLSGVLQQLGVRGCVGRVAQEFGDHPDAAAGRMRWVHGLTEDSWLTGHTTTCAAAIS
jgi:hypothetical protein